MAWLVMLFPFLHCPGWEWVSAHPGLKEWTEYIFLELLRGGPGILPLVIHLVLHPVHPTLIQTLCNSYQPSRFSWLKAVDILVGLLGGGHLLLLHGGVGLHVVLAEYKTTSQSTAIKAFYMSITVLIALRVKLEGNQDELDVDNH